MCLIKRGLKSAEVHAFVFVFVCGFGGILKLIDIEGVNSIAAHKASKQAISTKTNFLTLNPFLQSIRTRSFFFCYKYRIKHIIYHHRTTLFVKFSRFASFLFLFCCSHVFILVFVDFWIRFWLSIFRAVKKALKMKRKRQQQRFAKMKIWTCKWSWRMGRVHRHFTWNLFWWIGFCERTEHTLQITPRSQDAYHWCLEISHSIFV